jgi:L-lactate dehydrogenase (cytochrome)
MAGCSVQEMANARGEGQTLFWQIYPMTDLSVTEREVRRAVELGYRGLALAVDAVRMGKKERDSGLNVEEEELSDNEMKRRNLKGASAVLDRNPPLLSRFPRPS